MHTHLGGIVLIRVARSLCNCSILKCACSGQLYILYIFAIFSEQFLSRRVRIVMCPLPSARQHLSYGDCLEVKREYYQNSYVLDCVTQCSQSTAHLREQFLQVKQIGFVTLGPLHCVSRRLPRVVLL